MREAVLLLIVLDSTPVCDTAKALKHEIAAVRASWLFGYKSPTGLMNDLMAAQQTEQRVA